MERVSGGSPEEDAELQARTEDTIPVDGPVTVAENEMVRSIGVRARAVNLGRARRLNELLDQAAAGVLAESDRHEAEGLAHQIVGSAGTFGFAGVSRLAAEAELFFSDPDGRGGPEEQDRRLDRARRAVADLLVQLNG